MARLTRRKVLKKPGKENESSCEKDTVAKSKTRSNVKNRKILGDQTNCNTPDTTLKSKLNSSLKENIRVDFKSNLDVKRSVTALLPEVRNSALENKLTEFDDNDFRGFEDIDLTESPKLECLRELSVILERIPNCTNTVNRPFKTCKEFNDINEDLSDKRKGKTTSKTPSSRKKTANVVLKDTLNKNNVGNKSVSCSDAAKKGKGRVLVCSVAKPIQVGKPNHIDISEDVSNKRKNKPRVSLSLKRTAKRVQFENNDSDRTELDKTCTKENFGDKKNKKKAHVPIYATKILSDVDKTFPNEDRLHLYDFEVDENEPKVKKARKKPIRKMTKYKTYKNKMKLAGDEAVVKIKNKEREPLKEVKMNKTDKIVTVKLAARVVTPKPHSRTEDPKPYSPMEELRLPVMLADVSTSVPQSSCVPESSPQPDPLTRLDTTAASIPSDRSNCSYQSIYALPDLFIGSSTPIRCHWTDNSVSLLNRTQTINHCKQFDVSNCFGFDEEVCFEEPLVSPIKRTDTPAKPLQFAKKPTVDRPRVSEVIRMLRFGPDGNNEEEELPELYSPIELPANFYHECDTPEFSPQSIPASPEMLHAVKLHRKSYERPRKKVARFRDESESEEEEDEEEIEEIVPVRQTKKRGAPSKKEELELENWAKAFNQQCMEVENFNLCVE